MSFCLPITHAGNKKAFGELPIKLFFDVQTAPAQKDMKEATDLVLTISSGDIAVRIRRKKFTEKAEQFGFDWSIRCRSNGHKTEIHKLKEGFARLVILWVFQKMIRESWPPGWIIDMDKVRQRIFWIGNGQSMIIMTVLPECIFHYQFSIGRLLLCKGIESRHEMKSAASMRGVNKEGIF